MKVYYNGKHQKQRIYAQPGAQHPDVIEWMDKDTPKMFTINFKNNVAQVEDKLGKYLIDNKIVSKNKIIAVVDEFA